MQAKSSSNRPTSVFAKFLYAISCIMILFYSYACSNVHHDHKVHVSETQRESFVLVLVSFEGTPKECLASKRFCATVPTPDKTWKMNIKGSGVVLSHVSNETYILTAGHVCSQDVPKKMSFKKIPFALKIKTKIKFYDIWGNSHEGKIVHIDHENDICLVKSPGRWATPTQVAKTMPRAGERVFNIAAPFGIYSPGMVPTFEGFYCGSDSRKNEFYSIPTKPGSSGSPVFNMRGELISLIHSSSIMLESLGLGCALENLQEIIKAYVPVPINHKPNNSY